MTDYPEADSPRLKTVPITARPNKVDSSLLARAPGRDKSFAAFWDSLPDVLAVKDLRYVAEQIAAAAGRRAVVAMLGGHVIKVGLGPLLIELLRRRAVTHVAMNGSAGRGRSEEHTSELQSRLHLVCRLLLEKKKQY